MLVVNEFLYFKWTFSSVWVAVHNDGFILHCARKAENCGWFCVCNKDNGLDIDFPVLLISKLDIFLLNQTTFRLKVPSKAIKHFGSPCQVFHTNTSLWGTFLLLFLRIPLFSLISVSPSVLSGSPCPCHFTTGKMYTSKFNLLCYEF